MEKTIKKKFPTKIRPNGVYDAYIEPKKKNRGKSGKPDEKLIPTKEIYEAITRYNRHINNFNDKFGEWV